MEIITKVYSQDGLSIREDQCPEGWTEVIHYVPHSTPWDYLGIKHLREYSKVMEAAGIDHVRLTTQRTKIHPIGSGPGGRVRLGDDMTPGTYRLAVPADRKDDAIKAIEAHKEAINQWLHHGAQMPEACR